MIKFFQQYILFPKRFGFFPYMWLIWLIYPVVEIWPVNTPVRWGTFGLLVVFIWFYRNGFEATPLLPLWLGGQYVIGLILTVSNGWIYLFLFTAWELGSLPLSKRGFHRALVGYYLGLIASLMILIVQAQVVLWGDGTETPNLVMLLFLLLSPLAGKSVSNSYRRSQQLRQQNYRYASLIKRDERERIARDLHDTLGQSFSMITIKAELARKLVTKNPAQATTELTEIATASRQNLQLVREIVTDLRTVSLAAMMIEQAKALKIAGMDLTTTGEEVANKWPATIQTTMVAILREAVTNAINYSHADLVIVQFQEQPAAYQLVIADNGHGYRHIRPNAHGISGMRERATIAGGQLTIATDRWGTRLTLQVPREETVS